MTIKRLKSKKKITRLILYHCLFIYFASTNQLNQMRIKHILYFSIFFLIGFQVKSQICLNDVELDKISQDKVQEFVGWQQKCGIQTFEELKPSMQSDSDLKSYFVRENVYLVKKGIEEVWRKYLNLSPKKSWNGKKVSFGFLFSKKDKKIVYSDEKVSKIDTGMVIYLNLRLMKGLINVATAFEVITIDKKNKIIEFSYLSGNISSGIQRLQFLETSKGKTEIIHTSFYRSNNIAKNYFFYPYFHTRATNEFHRNIKRLM